MSYNVFTTYFCYSDLVPDRYQFYLGKQKQSQFKTRGGGRYCTYSVITHILTYFNCISSISLWKCWATQYSKQHGICVWSETRRVYFYQEKAFDSSATNKNELVVITNYIIWSLTWQITSGNHVKNMSQISLHMERARERGLVSKAKFIPRGIAGNGYDRRVNCTVIKTTYIFYRENAT